MTKVLAIIHGKAPGRHALRSQLETLSHDAGHTIDVRYTAKNGDAEEFASGAREYQVVVSCGGDGTNNGVVNGLFAIPSNERPAFSFIPFGSGNDFARNFPPATIERRVACWFDATPPTSIDVIRIRTSQKTRIALNMVTCGIGAEIAATVNKRKFQLPAALNYSSAIVQWLLGYKAPTLHIVSDAFEQTDQIFLAAFGNGTYAGNGLGLNPQSTCSDGKLGVTVIGNVGVIDFIKYQSTLKKAKKVADDRLSYTLASKASLKVIKNELAIETDGELLGRFSAGDSITVETLPGALLMR
jgi:diacylglycerol kinase (ATP)